MLWFLAILSCATGLIAAEWPYYGGDTGGTKYSALKQINKGNVRELRPAWILDTGDSSDGKQLPGRSAFEATPLVVEGVMYVPTPLHRLIAVDPETGKRLWIFDPKFDPATRVTLYTNRGVAFWRSGERKRIFLGDQMGRLFSVDATTGKADPGFGNEGFVDLKKGVVEKFPQGSYGLTSPVTVCKDVVVAGAWVSDGEAQGPSGDIRGFDAASGKQLWRFHTVPHSGEFGADTWQPDSWKDRGGANSWSMSSVDETRGLVFIPLTSPSTDFYGGDRKGANLFGDSVLALDCRTGQRRWHFQTVHHNLWDYDLPSQPVLVTVRHSGKAVQAVAQATKTGFVFLLDRDTGKPLFPVEERPVPRSPIPGEESWPTQPVPSKPPPFARQSMTLNDLTDVTPESRAECTEMIKDAVIETKLFDPITEKFTAMFPGTNGGSNWGGGSFDPATGILYVNSMDVGGFLRMVKRPPGSAIPYRNQGFSRFWDKNGYPCQKPPWGELLAIDLNAGTIRWRSRLGEFPELTKRGVPKTGTPNLGGSLVTAGGLVFIAATNDSRFRAFDKDTGQEVWSTEIPGSGHATPMTFLGRRSGKQFVAIAAGGGNKYNKNFTAQLVVFALPSGRDPAEPRVISVRQPPKARMDYVGIEEKLPVAIAPQPVAFSHKAHAEKARLKCESCHNGVAKEERATLPSTTQCMNCHRAVIAAHPEVAKLKQAHDTARRVDWQRVYKLPDFVFFSHARHIKAEAKCADCHGPVAMRDVLLKEVSTSMTACMDCHKRTGATVSCEACHQLGQ